MTKTQELYNKAKEAGKVQERKNWLKLGIKKKEGGIESTGPHKVRFISDKVVKGRDYHTKKERQEVEWEFKENGDKVYYRQPIFNKDNNLHYFVEKMKDFNYGDDLTIELKWVGDKNVIDVELDEFKKEESMDDKKKDIPVVEDNINVDDIPF